MSIDDLIKHIAQCAGKGDWNRMRPYFAELQTRAATDSGGLSGEQSARVVLALAKACERQVDDAIAWKNLQLINSIRRIVSERQIDRKALETAWDSFYLMLSNPNAEIDRKKLVDLMTAFRSARVFDLLAKTADRALVRFPDDATARRLYGQALIDEGRVQAGIEVLGSALRIEALPPEERDEVLGLLGRAHKQVYIDHVRSDAPIAVRERFAPALQDAINFYAEAYDPARPDRNYWHGVNVISLLVLARKEGLAVKNPFGLEPEVLAHKMIDALKSKIDEPKLKSASDYWIFATLGECYLALAETPDNIEKAGKLFGRFCEKADSFMLAGTVRQLEEVCRLEAGKGQAGTIVAMLKAAQMQAPEGSFSLDGDSLRELAQSAGDPTIQRNAESMVPGGGFVQMRLLQTVVGRAAGIAALCNAEGETQGTGFLVRGKELNPAWGEEILLLTNSHVVSDPNLSHFSDEAPLQPRTLRIVLEGAEHQALSCDPKALWQAPNTGHDASILRINCKLPEGVKPLDICSRDTVLKPGDPKARPTGAAGSRVSVIGYPLGGPLSLSVVGNITGANGLLVDLGARTKLDHDPIFLHYRAPTKPGNSGSPVFEVEDWTVVGLHHEGFDEFDGRKRLGGKAGRSYANEGVSIHSIRRAVSGES
jgi:hypothetical protein